MNRWLWIVALVAFGALVCALIAQSWALDRARAGAVAVARAAEAYRLDAADETRAAEASKADLAAAVARSQALADALARVRAVAPATPLGAIQHHGTAVEIPSPSTARPTGAAVEPTPVPAAPLFRFRCDTDLLAARTDAGNVVVDGETRLVREIPPPETVLSHDRWSHGTTVAWVAEPAKPSVRLLHGWGLAGAVIVGTDGLRPGFGVATPEWSPRIGRWQPSVGAIGTVHAGSAYVAAVVRF